MCSIDESARRLLTRVFPCCAFSSLFGCPQIQLLSVLPLRYVQGHGCDGSGMELSHAQKVSLTRFPQEKSI